MTTSNLVSGDSVDIALLCLALATAMLAVLAGLRLLVLVGRWLSNERQIRPGDWIRFSGFGTGVVEKIGVWRLELRTPYGIVGRPRSALGTANRGDSALSERCRLHATLTVLSAEHAGSIEMACDAIAGILSQHGPWAPGDLVARFVRHDRGRTMTLEVTAWLDAVDYRRYRTWRRQVVVAITNLAARHRIRCFLA
jgi:hypothetical protein